ncbi:MULTISPECIES: winged helix-turn-helix transcriptional regulator [Mucilaginibacter]|uniref:winged helix-turn-helix transcriptional regulator n=1 Tax=Mucilaginibacter TaxID=423349 RepID=UPI000B87AAB0|nr:MULTISPECIES: helix-turn-helix domain-containing protein [Mucilaginibacter]
MTKNRHSDHSCTMAAALSVISGKWKLSIINQLLSGQKRYSEINRAIPGMTEKMLSQQIRELEEDGIVSRHIFPEVPPRVEYSLTPIGQELSSIFYTLERWGSHYMTITNANGEVIQPDYTCYTLVKQDDDVVKESV